MKTDRYPIVETFHSIQGEGAWMGANAFFIRLGGCEVHCPWCDQKETWNASRYPYYSSDELGQQAKHVKPAVVIITGGEPLMHDLSDLTQVLQQQGLRVHLETSGAYALSGIFDWVTFSPKPYKLPHSSIYAHADELKVVIASANDLKWAEEQARLVPSNALKYLQPEWNKAESQQIVFDYVLKYPQWRISLQTHKYLGVR